MLRLWCERFRWKICAPPSATFSSRQGDSVVDLVLTKGLQIATPRVMHGPWSGASDHKPVVTSTYLRRMSKTPGCFTPLSVRKNEGLSAVAEEFYKERFPAAFEHITKAATFDEYTMAVDKLGSTLRMPWMVHTKVRPHRFRSFWTSKLEKKSKIRSALYHAALISKASSAWALYQAADKEIKREAREIDTSDS